MAWFDNLDINSPAYLIAACTDRYLRVIAGPGTGKSFAMKRRVGRLLESGVAPSSILPVTFTRVAAEDLHRELVGMGVPGCEELEGTTLHSLAMRILMRNHVLIATGRHPRPLNDFEVKPLEADLAAQSGGLKEFRRKRKAYEAAWARLQHNQPGGAVGDVDQAFETALISWLVFHRAMLIGEAIPQLYNYLHSNPLAPERAEFAHILVDEYQDLNRAEQAIIELLADSASICIVGDDDQSIYSFKYAHPDGIRDWLVEHEAANDLALSDCRRCPTQVVAMASRLIGRNVNRPVIRPLLPINANGNGVVQILQFQTLDLEVTGVVNRIAQLIDDGVPPGDILVLAQRGAIGTPIFDGLNERGLPVKSFYAESELELQETQRRFAILKLFVDSDDRVALRWLVGLGGAQWNAAGYRRIRARAEATGLSPWSILLALDQEEIVIPHTASILVNFRAIRIQLAELMGLHDIGGLQAVVDQLFPPNDVSVRDLRALALTTLDEVDGGDAGGFLSKLVAAIAKPEVPSDVTEVRIMSLHKSKGLSAPVTIIAGCIEGLLPMQPDADLPAVEQAASLEEQRRLFYVGITRVKAVPADGIPGTLLLTYSQRMPLATAMNAQIHPAQVQYGSAIMLPSRFLNDMSPAAPLPLAG